MAVTLDHLRHFTVDRSFFAPTTLSQALDTLGFVQADPIRAPARAQDLVLRHRVAPYRAGDLERLYATLDVEEDFFINYGFLARRIHALMHPRVAATAWTPARRKRAAAILDFVRSQREAHPRDVDRHFAHGTVTNYWGGSSNATTHLLDAMHYRGLLRVVRRDTGIRVYGPQVPLLPPADKAERIARVDALIDVAVRTYAPLPAPSLSTLIGRLRYAVPQWRRELAPAIARARQRLGHARVGTLDWYWPASETLRTPAPIDEVRFLAPFDPVVWDRRRFELLWGWAYRFEAYTPAKKRKLGYYALPLLWGDRVIGWANISLTGGAVDAKLGFVSGRPPRDRRFRNALDDEVERLRRFLQSAEKTSP